MGKNQFRESDLARKVVGVKFSAGSSEFIRQTSHIRVLSSRLYEEGEAKWNPAKHGPLDRRLGTSEVLRLCSTCGCNLSECVGHFGYIDLGFPVFHVGYFKLTIHVLQCICKNCSGLLLDEKQRSYYLRQIANPNLSYLHRKHLHSSMVKASKKNSLCPACGHQNGLVKKAFGTALKIVYGHHIPEHKVRATKFDDLLSEKRRRPVENVLLEQGSSTAYRHLTVKIPPTA